MKCVNHYIYHYVTRLPGYPRHDAVRMCPASVQCPLSFMYLSVLLSLLYE
jgi:hypothetical protein